MKKLNVKSHIIHLVMSCTTLFSDAVEVEEFVHCIGKFIHSSILYENFDVSPAATWAQNNTSVGGLTMIDEDHWEIIIQKYE